MREKMFERVAEIAERIETDPEEIEQDIRDAIKETREEMIAEYAEVAELVEFCPECGAVIGVKGEEDAS